MNTNEFPEFYEDEIIADELFFRADDWLDQLEMIASVMDMPELPADWDMLCEEPDEEFMAISDKCAESLLLEMKNA